MRSTRTTTNRTTRPSRELRLDPYIVQGTTWTREELLRARGIPVKPHRPSGHDRKAA